MSFMQMLLAGHRLTLLKPDSVKCLPNGYFESLKNNFVLFVVKINQPQINTDDHRSFR